MAKRNSQKQITRTYHSRIRGMLKGQVEKEIFDALSAGKNTYLRYDRLQSSSFDSSWIEMIEGVIFDLGEIIANPRMTTKVEGNIVPVELARKTGAESVQHLASHTQYIKEIDEYGNVIPSKIMTMGNEDDLHTYENRFIATLVRRLVLFIEKRYEVVSEFAELRNQEVLMFKNKSIINGAEVEIETKVKVAYKADDDNAVKSSDYIKRIREIRNYVLYFYNSSFMKQLKTERDVRNPILQTNIIRKNPKYHHCYEVYKFIETYDRLGVNYKVDENYSIFSEEEMNELNHTLFANYVTLRGKDISKNHKEIKHVYNPRILTSYDDEQFVYGKLLKGPIEFVRSDERYQEYLNSKISKDLPLHPTKHEKEYYADEYEEKRQIREDEKQKEDLIKRRNKELREFEKDVQRILKEREEARLALLRKEQEVIANEENDLLTKARNELIAASLSDQEKANEDFEKKEEEKRIQEIRDRVAATKVVEMSHPHQKPVSYEEACKEVWPQLKHKGREAKYRRIDTNPEPVHITDEELYKDIQPAQVPVEMSHPYSKPVTYDEACVDIWPQLKRGKGRPAKQKRMEAYPEVVHLEEEQPEQENIEPAVVPVPMSHPQSEPVTYEQAVEQIWPNIKGAPVLRVAPAEPVEEEPVAKAKPVKKAAPKAKKAPVEQEPIEEEIKPAVVPVGMSHPHSDPVTYDEAAEQIWPQIKNAPSLRVAPQETVQEEPVKEEPKAKKAPAKKPAAKKAAPKAKPVEKPVEQPKEQPKVEPAPVMEPEVKEEPKAEPVKQEAPKKEAPAPKEKKPVAKKPVLSVKKPAKKPVEKKPEPKKPEPKPVKQEQPREKIPGKFIVKTNAGYYVNKNKYSVYKDDAKIFDDFNLANDIKKEKGGKVVKL